MTTASELRPADPADARVWDAASTVHDPETVSYTHLTLPTNREV